MSFRSAIPDFQLANPLYIGAVVSFFTVTVNGVKTGVLANLYASPTGGTQLPNPQVLDAEGKFTTPVYHDVSVIAEVVSDAAETVDTGIILPYAAWGGNWTTARLVNGNLLLRDPNNLSIYITTNTYITSGNIPTDVGAGNLVLVFQGEAATIASDAAIAAAQSAADAANAAAQATTVLATSARLVLPGTTSANIISSGTTAERPAVGVGVIAFRYNITTAKLEMYAGGWGALIRSLGDIGDVDFSTPPAVGQGLTWNGTAFVPGAAGGGMFKGTLGTTGNRPGDIFRISNQLLDADVIIASTENASAPGPLTINTGRTVTVQAGGTLVIL